MIRRRTSAVASLLLAIVAVAVAVALAVDRFPRGVAVLACLWVALVAGWASCDAKGRCGSFRQGWPAWHRSPRSSEVPLGLGDTIAELTRIAWGRAHPAADGTRKNDRDEFR